MRLNHTRYVHLLFHHFAQRGDRCIDLTLGNGHDMRALLEQIGPEGELVGIDIATSAVAHCKQICETEYPNYRYRLLRRSHSELSDIEGPFQIAVYNLGYLPGSDKAQTTHPESTIASVLAVLPKMSDGGIVILTVYRGHDADVEWTALQSALASLQGVYITERRAFPPHPEAPIVYTIERTPPWKQKKP